MAPICTWWRNLPIDDDLKSAVGPAARAWIAKLGANAKLDIDGRVTPSNAHEGRDVDYLFDIGLHDGSLWPAGGTLAFSGLNGKMQLTPDQLQFTDFSAQSRRGIGAWTREHSVQ